MRWSHEVSGSVGAKYAFRVLAADVTAVCGGVSWRLHFEGRVVIAWTRPICELAAACIHRTGQRSGEQDNGAHDLHGVVLEYGVVQKKREKVSLWL